MDVNDQQDPSPPDDSTNHPEDAFSDDTIDEMQQTKKNGEHYLGAPLDNVDFNDQHQHTEQEEDVNKPESNDVSLQDFPPKRPQSSYFIFMHEQRSKIQQENPEATSIGSIAKIVGELWKNMSAEERKPYQEKAYSQKLLWQKEMEAFKSRNPNYAAASIGSSKSPTELILPVGRIKKLCRLDPEVKSMSKDAVTLVSKCAELFTEALAAAAEGVARVQKRKTLVSQDLVDVCSMKERFFFLKDDMVDLRQIQKLEERSIQNKKSKQTAGTENKKGTLTSFFHPRV